jgi:uncharacterized protein (DUF433 family)
MEWPNRISLDPEVLCGKPVIKGTRISVELILGWIASGWSEQEILEEYPGISAEDVRACVQYAQRLVASERVYAEPGALVKAG